ncbi:hypothetical protein PQX77_018150 [Marasmius sp. AFHP31]|nr:hypothetical protein PQX77_018150 [Marasmius sp. AFHP31]
MDLYDKGVRPAIRHLLPESASDWPASYKSESFRIRRTTGHNAYGTKIVPQEFINEFVKLWREYLASNDVQWAKDFVFIHTIRGVKGSTFHSTDPSSAEIALSNFLHSVSIPISATRSGNWFIDVGMQYHLETEPKECLQWTTFCHSAIVRDVLGVTNEQASRMTGLGSSRYERDHASHVTALSGCRVEPRSTSGSWEAVYIQLYTTEKAQTYCPERGRHGKFIEMKDAMASTQPGTFIDGLFEVYEEAKGEEIDSQARVEIRVPFKYALQALLHIPLATLHQSLVALPVELWWSFRAYRLLAMSQILRRQVLSPTEFRVGPDALLLTAAMVWLINSIHSRPDDGSAARSLMRAILPLTEGRNVDDSTLMFVQNERREDDDNGGLLPHNPYGLVFLRPLMLDAQTPRFRSNGPKMNPSAFFYWFRKDEATIRRDYHELAAARDSGRAARIPNKTRSTTIRTKTADTLNESLFSLEAQGLSLPPPPVDEGSDIEMDEDVEEQRPRESQTLDGRLSEVWRQCLVDFLTKAPNRLSSQDHGYLRLTRDQQLNAGKEVFQNLRLSDCWEEVYYKVGSTKDFDLAFGHLFPNTRVAPKSKNAQNYHQMLYYRQWSMLCKEASDEMVDAMKKELRKVYDELVWVPWSDSQRVWSSYAPKPNRREHFTRLPIGSGGPAPRILVRRMPDW